MSAVFNGSTQWLSRAESPGGVFAMCGWFLQDSNNAAFESFFVNSDGGFTNFDELHVLASQGNTEMSHGGSTSGSILSFTISTWRFMGFLFDGTTQRGRYCNTGDVAWAGSEVTQAGSTLSPTEISIGARFAAATNGFFPGKCAMLKLWSGTIPTMAQLFAERQYYNPVIATGKWAQYKFANGALLTDGSGNNRTLTDHGTVTFSSSVPTDILGDGGAAESFSATFSTGGVALTGTGNIAPPAPAPSGGGLITKPKKNPLRSIVRSFFRHS